MDPSDAQTLRALLNQQPVAALATLHGTQGRQEPATSMVPFVLVPDEGVLLIHVSALATHTRDMLMHPRVSLLVMAPWDGSVPAQALPRVSLQADAARVDRQDSRYPADRACYLARFPQAEQTFELADFSIFRLTPVSARVIAGFGRAHSLVGEALRAWLGMTG